MKLKEKKLFLLDMDGTIYLDNNLFDGTIEFLNMVKQNGGRYVFVTNNSSKSTDAYVKKLGSIGIEATEDDFLRKLRDLLKQLMSWCLKLLLYVFTAFISISGVISGTADQTAIKAAKLTISGVVPVVGGILADASESVLIGAGIAKNAVGTYGLFGILAVTMIPFMTVGIRYLLLKLTATLASAFAPKSMNGLLGDFSTAMGLILAMTGSVCLIQLISIVCFLRGMS